MACIHAKRPFCHAVNGAPDCTHSFGCTDSKAKCVSLAEGRSAPTHARPHITPFFRIRGSRAFCHCEEPRTQPRTSRRHRLRAFGLKSASPTRDRCHSSARLRQSSSVRRGSPASRSATLPGDLGNTAGKPWVAFHFPATCVALDAPAEAEKEAFATCMGKGWRDCTCEGTMLPAVWVLRPSPLPRWPASTLHGTRRGADERFEALNALVFDPPRRHRRSLGLCPGY
jgi:hypothetical protein